MSALRDDARGAGHAASRVRPFGSRLSISVPRRSGLQLTLEMRRRLGEVHAVTAARRDVLLGTGALLLDSCGNARGTGSSGGGKAPPDTSFGKPADGPGLHCLVGLDQLTMPGNAKLPVNRVWS